MRSKALERITSSISLSPNHLSLYIKAVECLSCADMKICLASSPRSREPEGVSKLKDKGLTTNYSEQHMESRGWHSARTRPGTLEEEGHWGMGSEWRLMSQQKLSCIREEEEGSWDRRNSVVTEQQSKNEAKYPVLFFRKTLFELHPTFLLILLWVASLFPCILFSQDLICRFPRSQRLADIIRDLNLKAGPATGSQSIFVT